MWIMKREAGKGAGLSRRKGNTMTDVTVTIDLERAVRLIGELEHVRRTTAASQDVYALVRRLKDAVADAGFVPALAGREIEGTR